MGATLGGIRVAALGAEPMTVTIRVFNALKLTLRDQRSKKETDPGIGGYTLPAPGQAAVLQLLIIAERP